MKKMSFVLLLNIVLLSSCLKQEEHITPLAPAITLSQWQREAMLETAKRAGNGEWSEQTRSQIEKNINSNLFYLNIRYHVKDLDVFESTGTPNSFEQIGHSFLARIAQFLIRVNGSKEIDIDPIDLSVPKLNLDTSIIKSIEVKSIFIKYSEAVEQNSDYLADFSFIKSIELYREVTTGKNSKKDLLYLSYYKNQNKCLFKCLQFNILNNDLLSIIKQQGTIKLKPNISIVSLPKVSDLTLDGTIELKIGLMLPF